MAIMVGNCRQSLVVSFVSPVSFLAIVPKFLTKTESSHSLPRSFFVKFSFRISLRAWTRMVAVLGQCPARVHLEDTLVGIRPRRLFFILLY